MKCSLEEGAPPLLPMPPELLASPTAGEEHRHGFTGNAVTRVVKSLSVYKSPSPSPSPSLPLHLSSISPPSLFFPFLLPVFPFPHFCPSLLSFYIEKLIFSLCN